MAYDFDLIVLGAGPAGEKGAVQAAYFGKRVAVVENRAQVGGVSAHMGTLPSKTLRETAIFLSGGRQRQLYGVRVSRHEHFAVSDLMCRKADVVDFEVERMQRNLQRHQVQLFAGVATFVDAHTISVTGETGPPHRITGEFILIATGSSPHRPDFIPFADIDIDDSDELLQLDRLPASLCILGGGVIGCEYACMFAALEIKVVLIDARDRILPFLDAELSEALSQSMRNMGIETLFEDEALEVEPIPGRHVLVRLRSGRTLQVERVLYTTGRTGNTDRLNLNSVGVEVDARKRVKVDSSFKTSCANVYAAGDVIGFPGLSSTAMEQGRVAVCQAFGFTYKRIVDELIPYGIYTIPEVSTVGEAEADARKRGVDVEVGVARYLDNARGQIIGDREGFIKLVFEAQTKKLLGVHILGERATELVHVGQAVLRFGGTIDYFVQAVFNYPTLSEVYKYAAYDGLGRLARRTTQ